MIYRAIQLIQIFLADERTDEGVPRGPRGPKNSFLRLEYISYQMVLMLIKDVLWWLWQ